ncbi:MAG: glycosyltransferase [Desulfobacteraceae bacterium]|nr:glycosyltransferase [Desulfobacteraceae bacterium]
MLKVSVVIPARDSQSTIRTTVETLHNQTRRPDEVIIVVGENDFTQVTIEDFITSGFVTMIVAKPPSDYVRDTQWKRWVGAHKSMGDIIFLTDSKVFLDKYALENALGLMEEHKVSVVGGITPGWPDQADNFWAALHDKALVSNVPQFPVSELLTAEKFGETESLPVTTALMMTREVFETVEDDFALEFSKVASTYDDYVLSWLIVKAGYTILVTNQVIGYHKHRINWSGYSKQIARSGQSAAIMSKMYPDCPFGARRLQQVNLIKIALLLCVVSSLFTTVAFNWIAITFGLLLSIVSYMVLGVLNVIKAKESQAFLFPLFTILLILNFALHFSKTYDQNSYDSFAVNKYLQIH